MSYGDVEGLIREWVDTVTDPTVTVIVEPTDGLPADLVYTLPLVAVSRYGGGDDTLTIDTANLDVDVYASTYGAARDLAHDLWTRARRDLPGLSAGGMTVSRVRTITAPAWRDWQATNVHLVHASVQVTVHHRIGAAS